MRAIGRMGLIAAPLVLVTGCALLGRNPSAPTKAESLLFTTVTNTVQATNTVQEIVPVYATNTVQVTVTNLVANLTGTPPLPVITVTNSIERVVDHWLTNLVTVVSNVPAYTETVKPATTATVQAAGSALNTFVPGIGGLVSSGILGLLSLWGYLRSSKLGDTSAALAQEIETVRTFVKQLPNGAAYDAALVSFLQAHQAEAGVTSEVLGLLAKQVSNPDAQAAATEVQRTLQQLQLATAPTPTPTKT